MGPSMSMGRLPNFSAANAAGTLLTIRAKADEAVIIPNSDVDNPTALARKGTTGTLHNGRVCIQNKLAIVMKHKINLNLLNTLLTAPPVL